MTDQPERPGPRPEAREADVAAAVCTHPAVLRLDGGPFGSIASYLPGHRLAGVRIGRGDEPTEVAVVVRIGHPFPALAEEIAGRVRSVLGPVPVEVTFSDVGAAETPPPGAGAPPPPGADPGAGGPAGGDRTGLA